ncbi:MAG: hypothetical protein LKF36_10075 [Lactobacillus sp.]|jgi:hypothetical protein|nr:hypothetical protein [Lactobacillus sp.]
MTDKNYRLKTTNHNGEPTVNEKIGGTIKAGNDKIAKTLFGANKKIEKGVVGTYKKIESAFVDKFLEEVPDEASQAKPVQAKTTKPVDKPTEQL